MTETPLKKTSSVSRKLVRRLPRLLLLAAAAVYLLPGPTEALFADYAADITQPISPQAEGHYSFMKAHFQAPFGGYGATEVFIEPFEAVFLSHAAMGFLNVALSDPNRKTEVAVLLDEVTRRALSPSVSPYDKSPAAVRLLGDHNLYLSHLCLILGARRTVSTDDTYDKLHTRIAMHLAKRSLAHKTAHAASYPKSARFPADQAALLASLYLYDRIHGTDLAVRPIQRWLAHMRRAVHPKTELPVSSVSHGYPDARLLRGCALSWTVLYMVHFAPKEAFSLYNRYQELFYTDVGGLGGFREYPPGIDREMNVDSGPVLFGMGTAATGIGIGPARLFKDRRAYVSILRTAAAVGLPPLSFSNRHYALSPLLGEAILFHGVTARPWEDIPLPSVPDRSPPFPAAPLIQFLLTLGLALLLAKPMIPRRRGPSGLSKQIGRDR